MVAENKKFLEGLQSVRDCEKVAENKAIKEVKLTEGLKRQLREKLTEIKEKNKALLDLQRKANERDERLLELQQKVSKIPNLEAKVKKLEETIST